MIGEGVSVDGYWMETPSMKKVVWSEESSVASKAMRELATAVEGTVRVTSTQPA